MFPSRRVLGFFYFSSVLFDILLVSQSLRSCPIYNGNCTSFYLFHLFLTGAETYPLCCILVLDSHDLLRGSALCYKCPSLFFIVKYPWRNFCPVLPLVWAAVYTQRFFVQFWVPHNASLPVFDSYFIPPGNNDAVVLFDEDIWPKLQRKSFTCLNKIIRLYLWWRHFLSPFWRAVMSSVFIVLRLWETLYL